MIGLLLRLFFLLWFIGLLVLCIAAVADVLFGVAPVADRLSNLLPRIVVAAVWPLAAITPRGRYLLWARWQHNQKY